MKGMYTHKDIYGSTINSVLYVMKSANVHAVYVEGSILLYFQSSTHMFQYQVYKL